MGDVDAPSSTTAAMLTLMGTRAGFKTTGVSGFLVNSFLTECGETNPKLLQPCSPIPLDTGAHTTSNGASGQRKAMAKEQKGIVVKAEATMVCRSSSPSS